MGRHKHAHIRAGRQTGRVVMLTSGNWQVRRKEQKKEGTRLGRHGGWGTRYGECSSHTPVGSRTQPQGGRAGTGGGMGAG